MRWLRRVSPVPAAWPPPRDPAEIEAALDYARRRSDYGYAIHMGFALLFMLTLPLGTSPKDIAFTALAICAVVRLTYVWRCYPALLRDRLVWLMAAWVAWQALSMLWSPDRATGLDELAAFRSLALPLALWPVVRRSSWLVAALLAGVFAHNLVQLAQHFQWLGLEPEMNGRLNGLLHPIHTGAINAAAMCWHLAALLNMRRMGWLAALSAVGLGAATAGLVFAGGRGPWIAAAVAVPMTALVVAARRPERRRRVAVLAAAGIVAALAAWPLAGDFVRLRVGQALDDLRAAVAEEPDYDSDVGLRLARWSAAWGIFIDHPLAGTGGGGYRTALVAERLGYLSTEDQHAHSLYLHAAATTGIVGVALAVAVLAACLARLLVRPPPDLYADACAPVLVSWLIGAAFDAYHLSGTMFGLFGFLAALALRPAARVVSAADLVNSA